MLVLSRRPQEEIKIGDHVIVKVTAIAGNRVKIGVSAPPDCKIVRGELPPLDPETPAELEPA